MAMRMPPEVAQQPVLPQVNRTSLVFFGGLTLIVLNVFWANGPALATAIFHANLGDAIGKGGAVYIQGMWDALLQVFGLLILVGIANYGGENAGTAALMFIGALWLLWLLQHMGTHPAKEAVHTVTEGGQTPPATDTQPGQTGPR